MSLYARLVGLDPLRRLLVHLETGRAVAMFRRTAVTRNPDPEYPIQPISATAYTQSSFVILTPCEIRWCFLLCRSTFLHIEDAFSRQLWGRLFEKSPPQAMYTLLSRQLQKDAAAPC